MELCRHETCVKYSGLGESCRELGGNEEALVKVIEEKKKNRTQNEAGKRQGVTQGFLKKV